MENLSGFDPSNTGKITHARVEKFLRRMGVKLSEDRSEALLRSLDPQGTGHVDVSSFAFSVKAADFASGPSSSEDASSSPSSASPSLGSPMAALRELHCRFGSTPPRRGFDIVKHNTPGTEKLFASKRRLETPETIDVSVNVPKCKITDLAGSHLKRPSRVFTGEGEMQLLPVKRKPSHRDDTDMFDPSLPYQHGFKKSQAKRPTTAPPESRLREVIRDKIYQVGTAKEAFEKLIHTSKGHGIDGKLTMKDLQKGLHDMNVNVTDRQARRLLTSCGSEDGRSVTYDKFASHIFDSPMHTLPRSSSTTSITSPSRASTRHIRPVHADSGDIISHTDGVVNSPRLSSPPSQKSSGNILAWE
jgi:Ca2+-binding EF-hand superfamily protein